MVKAVVFTSVGALFLVRGLFRPVRAVVKNGEIRRCAGKNAFGICDPSLSIRADLGEQVYANASGKVLMVGEDYVHLMSRNEPVILMYQGIVPEVQVNQHVAPGQKLGKSHGNVNFSVTQMGPGGVKFIEPSAWLAARGYKVVLKPKDSNLWCSRGREVAIPSEVRKSCDMHTPEKAGFALLPVNIEMN